MPARAQIATEEYQLPHNAATDIPNHSRRRNGSSESSTEREALRPGWSAVRNRSSFLVGAKVFELRFRIEPVVNATERYVDRDGPRPVVVQSSRNGKAFKNTPADEFFTEMGHVEIPGFHADGDGTIDGRHRRLAVSAWMIPESDVPKLRQRHVVRDETNVRRHPRLTVDFGPHVLFDLVVYLLAIGHVDDRFGFSTPLVDDVHGFFVLRFAHLRVLLPSVLAYEAVFALMERIVSRGGFDAFEPVELVGVPHARHLPFGWRAVAQASLVAEFRLVRPHVCEHVLADKRMHVAFVVFRRARGGLRRGLPVAAADLGVPFALAFDLGDGPVVGDLVPVVGETARGIDTAEPERVRGQPVDDREDKRQRGRTVAVMGFDDPADEVSDLGQITFGRFRGGQRQLRTDGSEMVHHGRRVGIPSRRRVVSVLHAGALPACGELSRRERGVNGLY